MIVFGIDPGPTESAWATWDGEIILSMGMIKNSSMLGLIKINMFNPSAILMVEGIQSYGRVVGKETFDTCLMIGRILEAAHVPWEQMEQHILYRPAIKAYLCGTVRANDADIRGTLIKRLGKEVTRGCKNHIWSALSVAVVAYKIRSEKIHIEKRRIS